MNKLCDNSGARIFDAHAIARTEFRHAGLELTLPDPNEIRVWKNSSITSN